MTKIKLQLPNVLEVDVQDGQTLSGTITIEGRFTAVLDEAPSPGPGPGPSPAPGPDPSWKTGAVIPPFAPTQGAGASLDLSQYIDNFNPLKHRVDVKIGTGPLPPGDTVSNTAALTYDGAGPVAPERDVSYTIVDRSTPPSPSPGPGPSPSPNPPSADWASRIAGDGVVLHHNFDSAAEVNQFRWTGGYGGGQDPLAKGSGGNFCSWVSSGGVDGGGFLRLHYPLGEVNGRGNSYWWRPFSPLDAQGTGRGAADPGAAGSIATQPFRVSDGNNVVNQWGKDAANPGWYGHPDNVAQSPDKYQGNDFYLQVRVRRAQKPGAPPNSPQYSSITGKCVWLTTTNASYTAQELVTYGQSQPGGDQPGVPSKHCVYDGQNFSPLGGNQPNEEVLISNLNVGWKYSGDWDCLLYHVTPGTHGGAGDKRTRFECWAMHDPDTHPDETDYTKIWDTKFSQSFDSGTNSVGSPGYPGWNALILAIYHNGSAFQTEAFDFDYDQLIFSKKMIPAPRRAAI